MAHPDVALAISQMRIAMTLPLEKGGNKKARRSENVNETDSGERITRTVENGKNKYKTTRRAKKKTNRTRNAPSKQKKTTFTLTLQRH